MVFPPKEQGSWGIYAPSSHQSLAKGCQGWESGITSLEFVDSLPTREGPLAKRCRICGGNDTTVVRSVGLWVGQQ